jgi:hypothetical protein
VSGHEDVLRQTLRFYREHAPANCKEANAIDAVLAELESLRAERGRLLEHERQTHEELGAVLGTDTSLLDGARRLLAERDDLRVEIVEAKESLRKAGSIGAGYLTRVERLEAALRNIAVRIGRLDPTLEQTPLHYTITCIVREEREALAPSAPEPAPECDPWCAHCAKRREQAKESEQFRADVRRGKEILLSKPEPAPAPTERVCRHDRYVGGICDSCGEPWGGHDRACRPGERR